MKTLITANRKLLILSGLAILFLAGIVLIEAWASANDSSIILKRPPGSERFILTINDPDGIQEFSLSPAAQFRYGGMLSGCNSSFSIKDVSFNDPADFTPKMSAYVIDCQNNTLELEIFPPVKGTAKSVAVKKEVPPPLVVSAVEPSLSTPSPREEKKDRSMSAEDIRYPVPELGNCQSEAECRSYCDNVNHAKECLALDRKSTRLNSSHSQISY